MKPPLFWITAGKLTLENISLSRAAGNTKDWDLLVIEGGTVEMKDGVKLSDNINKSEIYKAVHHDAVEMFKIGAISEDRMREYDKKCLVHEPETSQVFTETVAPGNAEVTHRGNA